MPTEKPTATVPCESCGKLNRVSVSRLAEGPKCGHCSAPLALDRPLVATDVTLASMARGTTLPVVVDFYADWCGPCKTMAPIFAEVAAQHVGKAVFLKLDTDQNPDMARQFAIGGIPTLVVLRDGREVARDVGALPRARLVSLVEQAQSPSAP